MAVDDVPAYATRSEGEVQPSLLSGGGGGEAVLVFHHHAGQFGHRVGLHHVEDAAAAVFRSCGLTSSRLAIVQFFDLP